MTALASGGVAGTLNAQTNQWFVFTGPQFTVTSTTQKLHATENAALGSTVGASGLLLDLCVVNIATNTIVATTGNPSPGSLQVAANTQGVFSITWTFTGLAAGTYTVDMCWQLATGNTSWNHNSWFNITGTLMN